MGFIVILRKKLPGLPSFRLKPRHPKSLKRDNLQKEEKEAESYYQKREDDDSENEYGGTGEKDYLSGDAPASTNSAAWLVAREGEQAGKKLPLRLSETIMGRDPDCDLILGDPSVSPKHAKIKIQNDNFYIFDLVSESGTYLNGHKLLRPKILYDWDEITLGDSRFIFRGSRII
jgi:hypothetical protein